MTFTFQFWSDVVHRLIDAGVTVTVGYDSRDNPICVKEEADGTYTNITSGTSGRVLYDNAGVLGEYTAVPVGFGGLGVSFKSGPGSALHHRITGLC